MKNIVADIYRHLYLTKTAAFSACAILALPLHVFPGQVGNRGGCTSSRLAQIRGLDCGLLAFGETVLFVPKAARSLRGLLASPSGDAVDNGTRKT